MSHAGVLRHFASKDELLVALLGRWEEREASAILSEQAETIPPREAIRATAERSERTRHLIELYTTLLGEATNPSHPARRYMSQRFTLFSGMVGPLFCENGRDLYASWDGLQLAGLYRRDGLAPSALLDYRIRRWEEASTPSVTGTSETWVAAIVAAREQSVEAAVTSSEPDREAQILTTAGRAFARNGFRSTSLREIAAELGTSHGGLLYYFSDKNDLLKAVLADHDKVIERIRPTPQSSIDRLYDLYRRAQHDEQPGPDPPLHRPRMRSDRS
ncbi:MAG: TetR/AcrR family transcriptional regulator [Aeromicrobium sp.]|nr:TetR/AcrR family transcriptional regulator [Aeromicrobium sp.]